MNQTTQHFRNLVQTGAEASRLFAGLAAGQRIEVQPGQFLPQHWQAVQRLADWLNEQAADSKPVQ